MTISAVSALPPERAREMINAWAKSSFFRLPRLGDRITIDKIIPASAYVIRLDSEYESRVVTEKTVAHEGGPIEVEGEPPDPSAVVVRSPSDFEDRTNQIELPRSQRIASCDTCSSEGTIPCLTCKGSGKTQCSRCHGRGYRVKTTAKSMILPGKTMKDRHGFPLDLKRQRTPFVEVREDCRSCNRGEVTCSRCKGGREQRCPTCSGSGRVVTSKVLTVQFRHVMGGDVVNPGPVPTERIQEEAGEVVVDALDKDIGAVPGLIPDVDRRVSALVQDSRAGEQKGSRLLLQRLQIRQVAVQEVAYRYGRSSEKHLWIYGNEGKLHAPRAPRPWRRILLAIGGPIAVLFLVILVALN